MERRQRKKVADAVIRRYELLLEQPHVNCFKCFEHLEKNRLEPACWGDKGCPIGEELASDPVVNEIAQGFKLAKLLHECNGVDEIYILKLKELGVWGDDFLLIGLESVFQQHKAQQQQEAARKDGRKTAGNFRRPRRR